MDKFNLGKLSKKELIELVSEKVSRFITIPDHTKAVLMPYSTKKQEHFFVITLDSKAAVINMHVVSIGTVNRSLVHPREVYRMAILDNAVSIIVAHNHPSGNTEPSKDDLGVTSRLVKAGEILGIPCVDHIIFGKGKFRSCAENGEMR